MGDATVNGDMPHSITVEHILQYPVAKDSVDAFKNNAYGAKLIDITNAAYSKLLKPFLPLFQTPAQYAKPYAIKLDEFGNVFLDKVDEKVPVLKSETEEVKNVVIGYLQWPVDRAGEVKVWLYDTYSQEYKKCGGDGYVAGGKAVITSGLVATSEFLNKLSSWLAAKKEEAKETAKEAESKVEEKTDN